MAKQEEKAPFSDSETAEIVPEREYTQQELMAALKPKE